ncbi:MAG: hypothetical protein KJ941_05400 [Bacteroidetes bacterium]|nr:hypothetical protein [Bacteroidota bacterium]
MNTSQYGCLWESNQESVYLVFFKIDTAFIELKKITDETNRFLFLENKTIIPIIFNSDIEFSTVFNTKVEEGIKAKKIILGGYVLEINGRFMSGEVLKSFYDR